MADNEERILITKVSGNCRNLRIIDEDCEYGSEGLYCAANPHSKEWEKISKNTCKKCKREKFLIGIPRKEAIEIMAKANWIAVVCAKNQIVPVNVSKEEWDTEWNKLSKSFKKVYLAGAEGSLNALLGVDDDTK